MARALKSIDLKCYLPGGIANVRPSDIEDILKSIKAKVIEVDQDRNRLILSAKEAADKAKKSQRLEKISHIEEGMVMQGKIVNMERFGIFVDVGGIQGHAGQYQNRRGASARAVERPWRTHFQSLW